MLRVAPEDLRRLVQQRWRCHGHLETAVEVIHGGGGKRQPSPCILVSSNTVYVEESGSPGRLWGRRPVHLSAVTLVVSKGVGYYVLGRMWKAVDELGDLAAGSTQMGLTGTGVEARKKETRRPGYRGRSVIITQGQVV